MEGTVSCKCILLAYRMCIVRREFFALSQSSRTEVVVTHRGISSRNVLHSVGVFFLLSRSLSPPLFFSLPVSFSSHSRRSLFCLLLLSCPFFLASLLSALVRDQHSQSLCHRSPIHHKYKLAGRSCVCAHK